MSNILGKIRDDHLRPDRNSIDVDDVERFWQTFISNFQQTLAFCSSFLDPFDFLLERKATPETIKTRSEREIPASFCIIARIWLHFYVLSDF